MKILNYHQIIFALLSVHLKAIKRRVFTRRLHLRKLHQVSSNVNVLKTDDGFSSLPLKDNKIYDTMVYNENSEMTPQIISKIIFSPSKQIMRLLNRSNK
jgi:hypothetical protein